MKVLLCGIAVVGGTLFAGDSLARKRVEVRISNADCSAKEREDVPSSTFDLSVNEQATVYFARAEGVGAVARDDTRGLAEAINGFPPELKEQVTSGGFMAIDVRLAERRRQDASVVLRRRSLTWAEFQLERAPAQIIGQPHLVKLGSAWAEPASNGLPVTCVEVRARSRKVVAPPQSPPGEQE